MPVDTDTFTTAFFEMEDAVAALPEKLAKGERGILSRIALAMAQLAQQARVDLEFMPKSTNATWVAERLERAWEGYILALTDAVTGGEKSLLPFAAKGLHWSEPDLYQTLLATQETLALHKGYFLGLTTGEIVWCPWLPAVEDLPSHEPDPEPTPQVGQQTNWLGWGIVAALGWLFLRRAK